MPGKVGMRKTVVWNGTTMETILAARQQLANEGWKRITKRETLYRLTRLPGWTKKHYDTLCSKTGEWQDQGLIPFGLWADDTGGSDFTPMTGREIAERLDALRNAVPASLGRDGYLHAVFVEHEGLVFDIADMLDFHPGVVSSQGQIRREHLHRVLSDWSSVVKELGGKGIKMVALVDYDKGGREIHESHRKWLKEQFNVELRLYGITADQVREARLPIHESHQIDGWASEYGRDRLQRELRTEMGID